MNRLAAIVEAKAQQVAAARAGCSLHELKSACADLPPVRDFAGALRAGAGPGKLAVIAEAKRRSPSAGQIVADYSPAQYARSCQAAGAACLSVLTDEQNFGGSPADLRAARAACALPVLRKDFIVDAWQVYETRAMGADCLLLICAAVEQGRLAELAHLAAELGLAVLVEIHAQHEIAAALEAGSELLGVNNRDLATLRTDLAVGAKLIPQLVAAKRIVIAESALHSAADAARMHAAGASALLVGEALLRAADLAGMLAKLARPHGEAEKLQLK